MRNSCIDLAVPGTQGALIVRRRPNCLYPAIASNRFDYWVIHAFTDRAFCSLPEKADAMALAKDMFRKLPRAVWLETDVERVTKALDVGFKNWVYDTVQARMKKMKKGARQ